MNTFLMKRRLLMTLALLSSGCSRGGADGAATATPVPVETPVAQCDRFAAVVQEGEVPLFVCSDRGALTLHEKEGGPALDRLDLQLAKDESLDPTSVKLFQEFGYIGVKTSVGNRGIAFAIDANARKLAADWSSPTCSATCLQDFTFWAASEKNQWVSYTYVQFPREGAEVTELVKVQRFRVREGHLDPIGAPVAVTLGDWWHKGTICKDNNPLCTAIVPDATPKP